MPRTARAPCLAQAQPGISVFGRATKAGVTPQLPAKKSATLPVSPSKKRKLQELENVDTSNRLPVVEEAETPSKTLKLSQLSVASPRSGHYASPKRTPSRRTRTSAKIAESPSTPNTPSKQRTLNFQKVVPEPKLAPRAKCITEFIDLHSAMVQALSIHSAHNGPSTPADLREFLPSVTRIWKKRKVQPKDLQRMVWVWERSLKAKDISYRLANYGLGKVCLERAVQIDDQPSALQDAFEQAFDLLWEQTEDSLKAAAEEDRPALFLETLGLAPIHESLAPFSAFQKGQQRLQDLRGGIIRMRAEKMGSEIENGGPKTLAANNNRRQGLLDRIRNKELVQSKLPPPPTKKELVRKSAAERVEEVAGILALLRLRDTWELVLRRCSPLSANHSSWRLWSSTCATRFAILFLREEVEVCIELLADARVAGHWINIVTINEMRSVVLKSCKDIAAKDIGKKVAQLEAESDKTGSCVQTSVLRSI
ncbi:hypothetical protein N7509_008642 [Penicillium cosmopolitanum]|uniref:DNA replication factor Cdt1 C-terminal domain-containing protein n=1 Tax=Penicillium cosmopolitanum TaxID=1131564 RepID=A0A9W9VMX3_9EURO|nr:uncharacterized protein N7509_008642 [Penicillium cosmopolitanum]KAJ5386101.1 hypothetical protein N7509_008642 [Penicillium cosmopolitanum]